MKIKLLFIFFIIPFIAPAQERALAEGRIIADDAGIDDVLVVNYSAQSETRTDSYGNFTISAKTGDLLIISDYKIESRKIRFTPDLIKNGIIVIEVKMAVTELEEVIIYKNNTLTAEALGIVPKGQKRYTPAERRLHTASSMKPTFSIGTMPGVVVPTDAIINAITGRTKMLKKALETERKEIVLEALDGVYTEEQIAEEFSIPEGYVNGFLYFIADQPGVTGRFINNNKAGMLKLEIARLAAEYLQRIKDE